jgi:hypothetical protein
MQCEYSAYQGRYRCERLATHVHITKQGDAQWSSHVCSDHSHVFDKPLHNVVSERLTAQKDAVRVIKASSKANKSYADGAVRPSYVWYKVIRFDAHGTAWQKTLSAFVLAKFRFESDAIAYADSLRARVTDYHYIVKAGRLTMGYSCTSDAADTLAVIGKLFATNGNPNVLTFNGRQYFFERGTEQRDGAITGNLMLMDGEYALRVGTIRIRPDGTIQRFPRMTKAQREECFNYASDLRARNPQLLRSLTCAL